jgi:voltage-gated potassium channel
VRFVASMIPALTAPRAGGSVRALVRLVAVVLLTVVAFSVAFQVIMGIEGRDYSWWAGVYWTLVTMSTLGFGDIVFASDLGRMFSVLVLVSGAVLLLVLLPFTFIQLVYLPWRAATREARAPRSLPEGTAGHVVVTGRSPMEEALMHRADSAGVPYVLVVEDVDEAVSLHDDGYPVLVGQLDDPATYRAARVERAAMVVAARSDQENTNIAFTVREVTDAGLVVTTANSPDAVDVLELAGADRVIQLGELLGTAFARRILAPTARSSAISSFDDLVIAEASAAGTELVGRSVEDLHLREDLGVFVIGLWDRGRLQLARPDLTIEGSTILLLAGTRDQLEAYDRAFAPEDPADGHRGDRSFVVVLGGGRVGRAVARTLREAGTPCRIVDRLEERVAHLDDHVVGDAADLEVLRRAGIDDASAVAITTHDDDTNIYLTLYCRKLRPDAEILGRVNVDRNVTTMHRAGADLVLSYASTGATEAWNALRGDSTLLLAEGLVVFRVAVPDRLASRTLREIDLRARTGCMAIALAHRGSCRTDLGPDEQLPADADLILIGDDAAEDRFLRRYVADDGAGGLRGLVRRLTRAS